jgi:hypothetical protein
VVAPAIPNRLEHLSDKSLTNNRQRARQVRARAFN